MDENSKNNNKRSADPSDDDNASVKKQNCGSDSTLETTCTNIKLKATRYKNNAVLLSYCGKNYYGMQLQRLSELNTIEDLLLKAMVDAELIEEKGKSSPQDYHFQRASRTDKGVSAVKQVISVKLPENITDIPERLNKLLPEDIRIFKVIRATKHFNSKNWCDSRTYSYLCPTYAFAPNGEENQNYRLSKELLEEINNIFNIYIGCHKFHNFTSGKSFHDASCNRYIVSMTAEEPFERDGYEWIRIKIHGHSFMLHQIRKMIGLAMAIAKGLATKEVIQKSWGAEKMDVPKAPGLGLVLEEPHFINYNKKFGSDGIHEALSWDSVSCELLKFREKYIDSAIIEAEINEKSMLSWLSTLPLHEYTHSMEYRNNKTSKENNNTDSTNGDSAPVKEAESNEIS